MRRLGGLVLGALALLTFVRAPMWRSDRTLWLSVTTFQPQQPEGFINLGAAWAQDGYDFFARESFQRAFDQAGQAEHPAVVQAIAAMNLARDAGNRQEWDSAWQWLERISPGTLPRHLVTSIGQTADWIQAHGS